MSKPNVELMDAVMTKISEDREHWNQDFWRQENDGEDPPKKMDHGKKVYEVTCNTAFCFAGWAVQLGNKVKPKWADSTHLYVDRYDGPDYATGKGKIFVETRAQRLLNIDSAQADALFMGTNNVNDLKRVIREIKEEADE